MEVEENESIPFLDVLVYRKLDGSLGHKVFRKKTHTDSYLDADSHHHPAQKLGIINTLETRVVRICDDEHLKEKISRSTHTTISKLVNQISCTYHVRVHMVLPKDQTPKATTSHK